MFEPMLPGKIRRLMRKANTEQDGRGNVLIPGAPGKDSISKCCGASVIEDSTHEDGSHEGEGETIFVCEACTFECELVATGEALGRSQLPT